MLGQTVLFENNFSTEYDFGKFTIVDYNGDDHTGDGNTWTWNEWGPNVQYKYSSTNAADDWLITPNLALKKGYEYEFSFSARAQNSNFPESYSILIGQGTTLSEYKTIKPKSSVTSTSYEIQTVKTTVSADGNYRFAIRCLSAADMSTFCINKVTITEGVKTTTPGKVTNVKVTAAPKGQLQSTITFNAPATTNGGETLASLSKIDVMRGSTLVGSISNPTPGTACTLTDNAPVNGWNHYSIAATSADGTGEAVEDSAFVGIDTPLAPSNINIADNGDGTATISWAAPGDKGVNGGYVDVAALTYNIYSEDSDGKATSLQTGVTTTNANVTLPSATEQDINFYLVSASSTVGEGEQAVTNIVFGTPYSLPYEESFANGQSGHFTVGQKTGTYGFTPVTYTSADGDEGSMIATGVMAGETAELNFGKITVQGASAPTLKFNYYAIAGRNANLKVIIRTADGVENVIKTINYANETSTGWHSDTESLANFAAQGSKYSYFTLIFRGNSTVNNSTFGIDAVSIRDVKAKDLAISVSAPNSVKAGAQARLKATVKNNGSITAAAYSVNFYMNDKLVNTVEGNDLKVDDTATFNYDYTSKVTDPDSFIVYATVDFDGEENASDNTSDNVTLRITQPTLPAINDLAATPNEAGVVLNWTGIATEPQTVTEGFEDYADFTISDFGPWTLYDGDGEKTWRPSMYPNFTNAGSPMAYIVFNPSALGIDLTQDENAEYVPHNGKKFAASMAADSYLTGNNDWLISEMLSGKAQTVKLYAKSFDASGYYSENFEVRYSTTGNAPSDFTNTVRQQTAASSWAEYSFELPVGAKYFAIVCTSNNKMMLQIDDITYEKGGLSAQSYNVYRDGELIANVSAPAATYTDATTTSGSHTYNVSAVYDDGESSLSNDANTTVTGISSIKTVKDADAPVYNISGQRVGKDYRGIVIRNGHKFIRK